VTMDRRRLEAVGAISQKLQTRSFFDGILGEVNDGELNGETSGIVNGNTTAALLKDVRAQKMVPGIINDISIISHGEKSEEGICIVAALSKTHRLGNWQIPNSTARIGSRKVKNGAVVFEVKMKELQNGDINAIVAKDV